MYMKGENGSNYTRTGYVIKKMAPITHTPDMKGEDYSITDEGRRWLHYTHS